MWNKTTEPSLKEHKRLHKRQLGPILQNEIPQYLITQLQPEHAADLYFGEPVLLIDPSRNEVHQIELENEPFQMGTFGLCGCTVVPVVSRKPVYLVSSQHAYLSVVKFGITNSVSLLMCRVTSSKSPRLHARHTCSSKGY